MNSATSTMVVAASASPLGGRCRADQRSCALDVVRHLRSSVAGRLGLGGGAPVALEYDRATGEVGGDVLRLDRHSRAPLAFVLVAAGQEPAGDDHRIALDEGGARVVRELAPALHVDEQLGTVHPATGRAVVPALRAGDAELGQCRAVVQPAVADVRGDPADHGHMSLVHRTLPPSQVLVRSSLDLNGAADNGRRKTVDGGNGMWTTRGGGAEVAPNRRRLVRVWNGGCPKRATHSACQNRKCRMPRRSPGGAFCTDV